MKTSMKIYETSVGKAITTTLGYIVPTATDAQIALAAQAFNTLTTNTYEKTEKIVVTEVTANGGDSNG